MISKFFIERPVLANVLAILMVVIGAVCLLRLPVAQYPNVVPPTISVTTRYPGAGARAVVDTVALPIEQQVNGVDGMIYMQSYSASDGSYSLTVTFKIGMDINFAQVLVQNRVSSALAQLPQAVQAQGVTVQQKSTAILQFVTLTSPDGRYDSLYLANYATINLQPELARLPGVGQVNIFGAGRYSMRSRLDPSFTRARSPRRRRRCAPQAEPAIDRRPARHAPGTEHAAIPVHARHCDPPRRRQPVREHRRQDRKQRPDDISARRCARRAWRPALQPGFHAQRQAGRGHRHLSDAGG